MVLNYSDNEKKLFSKSVPISVKDAFTNQSRSSHLFLTMEWQESCSGIYSRKVLAISLTDNEDPFFLYNLHLSEEDFQQLKASQDLLIDFASFPQHIIDYIEKCLQEEKKPLPKFILVFTINEKLGPSQLDIIETNQFKNLIHLSLKFVAATESAVRQYLVSCFRNLKEENRLLQNKLSFTEQDSSDKLAASQIKFDKMSLEFESLRRELEVQLDTKERKHALELEEERNRLIARHKEEENRMEREKKDREVDFKRKIQQLESRVSCLDTLNKELQDKNYKLESKIRELKSSIYSLEDNKKMLNENIQSFKEKYENLQSEFREKQLHIRDLNQQINDAEQEIRNKAQNITRLTEQIEAGERQMKNLKLELENVNLQLEMNEKTRKVLDEEKCDLEKIIINLQDHLKQAEAKIALCAKYKEQIDEKDKLMQDLKNEVVELNLTLKSTNEEIRMLNTSKVFLEEKLELMRKDLTTKDNVIKYLNRELTDHCIIPKYTPPTEFNSSPSSVAQKQLSKINSTTLQKSAAFDSSPTYSSSRNVPQKSVRIETASDCRRHSSSPSQFEMTHTTDSAYYTSPSGFTNQVTPDNLQYSPRRELNEENFENLDSAALSAAFGTGDQILKHSTAKKSTKPKPARSATPKTSKKR